ncbi:universal stress protein [Candidatus Nitrosotenuis uzonensis]|nr:universal stress protein [Candidatus Nitrosotenuis uzonensis]
MGAIKRILVPIDGSDNSFRALDTAIILAKDLDAKIIGFYAVNVLPITEAQICDPLAFQMEERKYALSMLGKAKSNCQKEGVDFAEIVEFGSPADVILRFIKSKNNKIDLVVMGSRGRTAAREFFFGSISNYILHKSPIPVLIVK